MTEPSPVKAFEQMNVKETFGTMMDGLEAATATKQSDELELQKAEKAESEPNKPCGKPKTLEEKAHDKEMLAACVRKLEMSTEAERARKIELGEWAESLVPVIFASIEHQEQGLDNIRRILESIRERFAAIGF